MSVNYGPPQPTSTQIPEVARLFGTKPKSYLGCILVPFAIVLVVAVVTIISVIAAVNDSDDDYEFEFDQPSIEIPEFEPPPTPPPPQLFGAQDFETMLDAVRDTTGSTQAFEASIYPGYAVLAVPAEPTGQRGLSLYYNGELVDQGKGRSTYERFDLARVDPAVLMQLVREVRGLVEDPTSWYVIIRKPGPPFDNGAWLNAYASNEFHETARLQATLDGTVVERSVSR